MNYYVYYSDDTVGHSIREFQGEDEAREFAFELVSSDPAISLKIIKGFEITDDEYV
jgi:hypothetical protein